MDTKRDYRVVTNPEAAHQDVKVYPGESWANPDIQKMLDMETAQPGSLLYSVADYAQLTLFLANTEQVKDIPEVRFCAAGRGYVKYDRKPDGATLPPEDALIRVMESAPALPRPGASSMTVRQDLEHPEGYVVDERPGASLVDRFIDAYMALGGTLEGLVGRLESLAKTR